MGAERCGSIVWNVFPSSIRQPAGGVGSPPCPSSVPDGLLVGPAVLPPGVFEGRPRDDGSFDPRVRIKPVDLRSGANVFQRVMGFFGKEEPVVAIQGIGIVVIVVMMVRRIVVSMRMI